MIDIGTGLIISTCIVVTYTCIKFINRMFDTSDKKKKNSLF